jgi:hypothetical protein
VIVFLQVINRHAHLSACPRRFPGPQLRDASRCGIRFGADLAPRSRRVSQHNCTCAALRCCIAVLHSVCAGGSAAFLHMVKCRYELALFLSFFAQD